MSHSSNTEVIQFIANPSSINRGQSSTLSFQGRYASSITITGSGVNQTFPGNSGTTVTSGSVVVSPTTDSTYLLTATGRGGTTKPDRNPERRSAFEFNAPTNYSLAKWEGNTAPITSVGTGGELRRS